MTLINHGQKVLGGSVREIKRGFGWRYVAIDGDNLDEVLNNSPLVSKVVDRRDHKDVTMAEGHDPQELLKYLVSTGANVTRFEMVAPSLNEIFIESVTRVSTRSA